MSDEQRGCPEVRLSDETIEYLERRIASAVAEALEHAIQPDTIERFWASGFALLAKQAREGAGDFVIGGVRRALRTALWVGFGALILYSAGGWAAVRLFWLALAGGPK